MQALWSPLILASTSISLITIPEYMQVMCTK